MTLSLALCIAAIAVAFVCTCYGIISILKIHKQEKADAKKERMSKHLYLSTGWRMLADICGIKISNITPVAHCGRGFKVVFSKKSSDRIEKLTEGDALFSGLLSGHLCKLDSGRYCYINDSLSGAKQDIEKLLMYCNMMTASSVETGGK